MWVWFDMFILFGITIFATYSIFKGITDGIREYKHGYKHLSYQTFAMTGFVFLFVVAMVFFKIWLVVHS